MEVNKLNTKEYEYEMYLKDLDNPSSNNREKFAVAIHDQFNSKIVDYYYDNDFIDNDTTKLYQERISNDNLINSEPITRGGYKNSGNIFNVYSAQDYLGKISLEINSRASIVIMKEK